MKRVLMSLAALLLAGCGQPGGLYLPDEPAATVEQTPVPADASTEEARKKK